MEQSCLSTRHKFDKKYKIVVRCNNDDLMGKIDWLNQNSRDSVDLWIEGDTLDVAFENTNDALVFKIKYSV